MEIFVEAVRALWQVVVVGLLLGAGLPIVFAVGVWSLEAGRQVTVDSARNGELSTTGPAGMAGAVVCFGVCVLAVAFGLVVIVFGEQLFGS